MRRNASAGIVGEGRIAWPAKGAHVPTVEFRVFGTVGAAVAGRPVDAGYTKQRTILALLAVEAQHLVTTDQVITQVWGDRPPSKVRNVLYGHIARLRRALDGAGGSMLRSLPGGYLLDVDRDTVDLHRFRRYSVEAACSGNDAALVTSLTQALALWRGQPLAGTDGPWATWMRDVLENERLTAQLDLADARLRLRGYAGLVGELTGLAEQHELHEGVAHRLILALHLTGRTIDALRCFTRVRRRLVDELGVEPSIELTDLHRRILCRDPVLNGQFAWVPTANPPQLDNQSTRSHHGQAASRTNQNSTHAIPQPH